MTIFYSDSKKNTWLLLISVKNPNILFDCFENKLPESFIFLHNTYIVYLCYDFSFVSDKVVKNEYLHTNETSYDVW